MLHYEHCIGCVTVGFHGVKFSSRSACHEKNEYFTPRKLPAIRYSNQINITTEWVGTQYRNCRYDDLVHSHSHSHSDSHISTPPPHTPHTRIHTLLRCGPPLQVCSPSCRRCLPPSVRRWPLSTPPFIFQSSTPYSKTAGGGCMSRLV